MTPFGNIAILRSVNSEDEISSAVMPWQTEPDTTGPKIFGSFSQRWSNGFGLNNKIGIGCNEPIEPILCFCRVHTDI